MVFASVEQETLKNHQARVVVLAMLVVVQNVKVNCQILVDLVWTSQPRWLGIVVSVLLTNIFLQKEFVSNAEFQDAEIVTLRA